MYHIQTENKRYSTKLIVYFRSDHVKSWDLVYVYLCMRVCIYLVKYSCIYNSAYLSTHIFIRLSTIHYSQNVLGAKRHSATP